MAKKVRRVSNFATKPMDFILCITVILLLALGLIMVLSASSPSALSESGNSYKYFERQGIFAIIGLIGMFIISKIDYRFYKKFSKIAYIASIVLLLLVAVPGLGKTGGGAKRWLELGPMRFQPSEVAKIGLIIFFAAYLTDNRKKLSGLWEGFIKPFLFLAPIAVILLLVQDHLSASVVIILVTAVMMITAGVKLKYFLTVGVAGAAARRSWIMGFSTNGKGSFSYCKNNFFLESLGRCTTYRLADYTKFICYWFRRNFWSWIR